MAQSQKHWVQALLGEDAHVPFPYFYDVSSWSNPLLMGLEGGVVRNRLALGRRRARRISAPPRASAPRVEAPAYAFNADSSQALEMAFALLREGVALSRATRRLDVGGDALPAGAVVVGGGTDVARLRAAAARFDTPIRALPSAPADGTAPLATPKVALLSDLAALGASSTGFSRFLLEQRFGLHVDQLDNAAVETGALLASGYDVLVVPDGLVPTGALTPAALLQIQLFVRGGGDYVGMRSRGLTIALASGLTTASQRIAPSDYQVPGALFRARVDTADPVAWGFGARSWIFNAGDPILGSAGNGRTVVSYADGEDFFVSGYTEGSAGLAGTPAVVAAEVGAGHVTLTAFDPAFRAYYEAGERLLANALLQPPPVQAGAAPEPIAPALLATATAPGRDSVVRVGLGDESAMRAAAEGAGLPQGWRIDRGLRDVTLHVPNPAGLDVEQRGWVAPLLGGLRARGLRPSLLVL